MPMASEALSPAAPHNSRSSANRPRLSSAAGARKSVAHSMVRGAMRIDNRSGSSAGSESAMRRARSQLSRAATDVAIGRPRCGAHVPAVGGVQLAGGLQMFGDQRRILVSRARIVLFDRSGQALVPLGAIGFQLRFVGHRADQRVVEGVLGTRGEPHLIDQLRADQLIEHRIDAQRSEQLRVKAGSDHRRRVQRPPRWRVQPVDARLDGRLHGGRHGQLGGIRATDVAAALARQAPRAAPTRGPSPRRKTGSRRLGRR